MWGRAMLCAIGVSIALLGFCVHGTLAHVLDDSDDDEEIVDAKASPWPGVDDWMEAIDVEQFPWPGGDDGTDVFGPKRSSWHRIADPIISSTRGLDFLTGGMPDRLIYFAGVDIWRYGLGGYAGFQWAPRGIHKDGFILRASMSDNIESYTTRTNRYVTEIARGSLMAGLKFSHNRAEIQFLAGYEGQADILLVNGRMAKPRARFGTRFTTDVWWEPTASLMLQGSLSGTTIDNAISMRAAAGWRLFDRFWVGPEASRSSDYFSTQTRFGAHLTGLRTGDYEWSIAGGHIEDSFNRDGIYARIGLLLRPPRPVFAEN
jgi:hypothetical protein